MESAGERNPGAIWLCGTPRFVREALAMVLRKKFFRIQISESPDLEPPELPLPFGILWLIWFVAGNQSILRSIETIQPRPKNLLLIQNDGNAFVRWADNREMHLRDISLERVIGILETSFEAPRPGNMTL